MICIQIGTDGTARAVYTEALPLTELGQLSMQRASTVEFNESNQQWEVRLASHPNTVAYSHESRSDCIRWEVDTLNRQLMND